MASRSQTRSRKQDGRSAFSWGDNAGPLIAAGLAGAAIGLAANLGRKFAMQGLEASAGDWFDMLRKDHDEIRKILEQMLATDETQTWKRGGTASGASRLQVMTSSRPASLALR